MGCALSCPLSIQTVSYRHGGLVTTALCYEETLGPRQLLSKKTFLIVGLLTVSEVSTLSSWQGAGMLAGVVLEQ